MRDAAGATRFSSRPHPELHPGTPAWAEDGQIVLGPPSLLLSPEERADVMHHETIHVLQQRLAPADETAAARDRSERLADRPRGDLPAAQNLLEPVPRLLAAPVKGKPASGFTRLFAGNDGVIGEVVDAGVTVRAQRSYKQLGIEAPVDPTSQFETATMTDLQFLSCGNRVFPALHQLAKEMLKAAQQVAAMSEAIPKGSPWRVKLVLVVNEASRLHFADGEPLITLSHEDFDRSGAESAAHEAAHAVFESHSHSRPGDPDALAPDAFALRFADLFRRLQQTQLVPVPTEPFNKKKPPLTTSGAGAEQPAGLVMVTDSLWASGSGERTEGHPWDGVDELFASAYAAFRTNEQLLRQLIAHYAKADGSVKKLGTELLDLLKAVKDPKALKALKAPAKADATEAEAAIAKRESQPSQIKDRLGAILKPETLPPETVVCPK